MGKYGNCEKCGNEIEDWYRGANRRARRLGIRLCHRCALKCSQLAYDKRREFDKSKTEIIAANPHLQIKHCVLCESTEKIQIDHIVPLIKGGTNEPQNLQVLCGKCNRAKWFK